MLSKPCRKSHSVRLHREFNEVQTPSSEELRSLSFEKTLHSVLQEVDLCHYHGKIRGIPESWVALSTCEGGLSGVVYDGTEMHHVEKSVDGMHFVYKQSDLVEHNKTCGYTGTDFHNPYALDETRRARVSFFSNACQIGKRCNYSVRDRRNQEYAGPTTRANNHAMSS